MDNVLSNLGTCVSQNMTQGEYNSDRSIGSANRLRVCPARDHPGFSLLDKCKAQHIK